MMDCLQELFTELGEGRIQEALPFRKGPKNGLPPIADGEVTRSYAIAFGLLNLAEEVAAEAMRRLNETINGPQHEPGSWAQAFRLMKAEGTDGEVLANELPALRVEPVLTAHPTEARRRSVLACMQEIHSILVEGGGHGKEHPAERELRYRLKVVLERWWRTEEVRTQRPTVDMEREGIIHCLAGSMAQSIAETDRRLREAWQLAELGEGGPVHPAVRPPVTIWYLGRWRS
jgi:phosphoenolpyruvate carboxylase